MRMRQTAACAATVILCWVMHASAAVVPQFRGVYDPGNNQPLQALWGYTNTNGTPASIPIGLNNYFNPGPIARGQPTVFNAGTVYGAFITSFTSDTLTWHAGGSSATATAAPTLPYDPAILLGDGAVVPLVTRVWAKGPDDYMAEFGYASGLDASLALPHGVSNYLQPAPAFRGQPTLLQPGLHDGVFTVPFSGESVSWTLSYGGVERTATAFAPPVPEPAAFTLIVAAGAWLVGRRRRFHP